MPIQEHTRGRRIMVAPNALVGPFEEGTVLSEEYLSRFHNADLDHILRNGGAIEVDQSTPLSAIPGADLAPLIARAYPVAGGHREPAYLNPDGSPAKMVEVRTPAALHPAPGQVPDVKQTEEQRLAAQSSLQSGVVPKTDEELHKDDEPPIEEQSAAGPKGTEPVDLEQQTGTGVNTVVDETNNDTAHRATNKVVAKDK